jgi:hypothetical protein
LQYYNSLGARLIDGWFTRIDAEMFSTLLLFQRSRGIQGASAEIGVHHGKSFIAICLANAGEEKSLCLDVFDDQHLNKDHSGRGSLATLRRNLKRYNISDSDIEIIKASSLGFPPDEILTKAGPLRFISIDGGHWSEIVENDLEIARQCAAPGQIIALDDFLSVEWSGVTVGFFNWYQKYGQDYCPLAITGSKLYLCQRSHHEIYSQCLLQNRLLRYNTKKVMGFLGVDVPVISGPNAGVWGRVGAYLRKYNPALYQAARRRFSGA